MFLLLLVALAEARSDDVLVYQPLLMPSHATFMSRLIEVLADANYSVTVLVNRHREDFPHGCDKANEIISVPPVGGVLSGLTPDMGWKVKETPSSQWQAMNYLTVAHGKQCKALLNDKEVLDKLRRRKFRVLVHEVFDMCGLVLMKILNIEKHVIVSSTRQMDTVGYELGLTDPFHHAGILADYGCTFGWQSVLRNAWFIDAFLKFTDNQVNFYRDELKGLSLPTPLRRLSRSASAVFLNTHALADSWRSSLRNVHEIGGIALHKPKPLTAEMESHLKEWKKVVYISFGTVVPSAYMPDQWKKNLAAVIKSFPDVLFLWKYEVNDVFSGQKMANVIMSPFFPQNDLLHSGLLTFFITHGGQNSVLEAASAGVMLLVIPQFGDQFRNAHAVRERGLGKVLAKKDLGNFKVMQQAIESMINEETCHKNVSHLINTEAAARTFVERMEEALQSGLTFDDGPQVWDSLKIIYYIWTIMCAVAVLLGAWIVLRLYRVFAPLYSHIYTIVYPEQKS